MLSRSVLTSATVSTSAAKMSQALCICAASAPASNRVTVMGMGMPATLKNTSPATISTKSGAGNRAAACTHASPFIAVPFPTRYLCHLKIERMREEKS